MVRKTSDSGDGLKETKTPQERGLLFTLAVSGTAICICEPRVTLYSHRRQRRELGFLTDRQTHSFSLSVENIQQQSWYGFLSVTEQNFNTERGGP